MLRLVKYVAIGLGILVALFLVGIAVISAMVDPNTYKPLITKVVYQKKQRTLEIPGQIKLTFFPKLGVDLGKVSISEHKSSATFASMESARVSLALFPLLSKRFVVDQIKIDGLNANIQRHKDGTTNFDDLLSKDEQESQSVQLDIDGVTVTNSNIFFDDQMAGRKLALTKVDLKTGSIANAKPSTIDLHADVRGDKPVLAGQVAIKSGFNLNLDDKRYTLNRMDVEFKGQAIGFANLAVKLEGNVDLKPAVNQFALEDLKISAENKQAETALEAQFNVPKLTVTDKQIAADKIAGQLKLIEATRNVALNLAVPSFNGTPQAFKIPSVEATMTIKQGELDAQAKLTGAIDGDLDKLSFVSPRLSLDLAGKQGATAIKGLLTTAMKADLKAQHIELPKIESDFALPNPSGGTMAFKTTGNADVNLAKQTLVAQIVGRLDQSAINGKIGLTKFSPAAYTFDFAIDQIDVDRYRKKTPAAAAASPDGKAVASAEQPIDLSALKDLNANGTIKIGALKVADIRASNVRLDVHAAGGKLEVSPLDAVLYLGSLSGSVTVSATTPPRFSARQTLSNVNIGPLMKDAIGKQPLEGRGDMQFDIVTQGALVSALTRGLNGTAKLNLHDGAVHGFNIAKAIRTAKTKAESAVDKQQAGTTSSDEKTDFSELSATWHIANGIAHNDDLNVKSPLFRMGGSGNINLVNQSLDYTVRTTVVSSLQGQGGPELQTMKGLTIPVKLYGPFTAVAWRIDFTGLVMEAATQKLQEQIRGRMLDPNFQEKLKGLFGR